MAPNMLPWSVRATAGMPMDTAVPITSSRRLAPSRRLYWLCRWRWTKSVLLTGGLTGRDVTRRRLARRPAVADDVVEPGGDRQNGYQIEQRRRDRLEIRRQSREQDHKHRHHLDGRVDLAEDRHRELADTPGQVEDQPQDHQQHVPADHQHGDPDGDLDAVVEAGDRQRDVGGGEEDLVRDRIEVGAEQRLLIGEEAGDEAVE